jgi:hypothetical protein
MIAYIQIEGVDEEQLLNDVSMVCQEFVKSGLWRISRRGVVND